MTQNQIRYWSYKEDQRHNLATELLTSQDLSERKRHNLETESQGRDQIRLGYANLELGYKQLAETTRHNKAQEGIGYANIALGYANLAELTRHNKVTETEAQRHNRVSETISRQQANAQTMNAGTNRLLYYQKDKGTALDWYRAKTDRYNFNLNRTKAQAVVDQNTRDWIDFWIDKVPLAKYFIE